jgi:DNA-binding cell septation regulator SpoVG|nr:MAG TPA: SpoVG [Caudoviricetes sp.]
MAKANTPKTTHLTTKVAGVTIEIDKKTWSDESVSCNVTLSVAKAELVSIYGIRIVEGKKGKFLSMPARKGSDGNYYSHAYIADEDVYKAILETVTE